MILLNAKDDNCQPLFSSEYPTREKKVMQKCFEQAEQIRFVSKKATSGNMRPQHPGHFFVLFHDAGNKITGTCVFILFCDGGNISSE